MVELGKVEPVDLRVIWEHEAHDFTPWLSDNLSLLGEELGLDLELRQPEARVGSFSLDILARNRHSDCNVTIENQLTETDHSHLGQLLTYASGHDAGIVIWIASSFREEHRAAIDWLNSATNDDFDFYGVEISAIRIGDSLPALQFQVVVRPAHGAARKRREASLGSEWYLRFYQPLLDDLKAAGWKWSWRGRGGHSVYFSSGFEGMSLGMYLPETWEAQVLFWMDLGSHEATNQVFDGLEADQVAIETELGLADNPSTSLWWERRGRHRYAHLGVIRTEWTGDGGVADGEIRAWMGEYMERLYEVFKPRLERLTGETDDYDG